MNINNNNSMKNCKSDEMADEDLATEAFMATTQNNHNARQLNNGQIRRDSSTLKSLFSGSKRKGIAYVVGGFVLLAGIVAICASFAMLGVLSNQRMQIRNLQSELQALKEENIACKNETTSLIFQLTTCEKELQSKEHQLEINSAQCEREKANITAQLKAEIRESEHEREIVQEKLNACQLGKQELSQRLETQTRNAEDEKKTLGDRLEQCRREQRELSQGREEEIKRQVAERVAAQSSWAVNREPCLSDPQSRHNGARRLESLQAILMLSSMFLFKVLVVV